MERIGQLLLAIIDGMKQEFTVYGYDISLWQIFMFTVVGGIIMSLIGGFFSGK